MPHFSRYYRCSTVCLAIKPELKAFSMSTNRLPSEHEERRVAGLLGLAFDANDGHKRITRGKNFLLAGGSDHTHTLMRETIVKVTERLDERGQELADVSVEELRELIDDVQE